MSFPFAKWQLWLLYSFLRHFSTCNCAVVYLRCHSFRCDFLLTVAFHLCFCITLILWSSVLVCSTFAIFVPHLMGDMHASLTGPIHLQGLLIRGVERNCSRNSVYSLFFCRCTTFLDPGHTQRGDETFPAVSCQTRPTCFPSKVQSRQAHSYETYVRLPSFVCAFAICRSQSPDLSFSLSMISLFSSFSVMCGPSKITVSELRLDANL